MEKEKCARGPTEQEVEVELKTKQVNVEAGRLAQFGEEKKPKEMESTLSEAPLGWAPMAPEVVVPFAFDGQKQMGAGIPCASAHGGDLDRPGALLHQEFSKESNWDDATGPDGDDQEDQTEPPSGHYHESTGPEFMPTPKDEEGAGTLAICGQRINGPYRITNGNEANSVE